MASILSHVPRDGRILIVYGGDAPGPATAQHAAQAWCLGWATVGHVDRLPHRPDQIGHSLDNARIDVLVVSPDVPAWRVAELVEGALHSGAKLLADVRDRGTIEAADGAHVMLTHPDRFARAANLHCEAVLALSGATPPGLHLWVDDRRGHIGARHFARNNGPDWSAGLEIAAAQAFALGRQMLSIDGAWQFATLAAIAAGRRPGPAPVTWPDLERAVLLDPLAAAAAAA